MNTKSCCVTGHRSIPTEQVEYVRDALLWEIKRAIDDGYTKFYSGYAEGVDLIFASIIIELRAHHTQLILEGAIPYPNRLHAQDPLFQAFIAQADNVHVVSPFYAPDCFMKRNRFMVDRCERVIAVCDGRKTGGTVSTLCYAIKMKRDVRLISIG